MTDIPDFRSAIMTQIDPGGPIRIFLSVCRHQGFASAATALGLSPSAVAKAVARLEMRLAVRLFERTTRSLSITADGARYRDVCMAAIDAVTAVETELGAAQSQAAGRVRVTLPPLLGTEIIASALYALSDRHPLLVLDISLDSDRLDLISHGMDLAVRIGEPPDVVGLTGRRIGEQRIVLCAAAAYLERRGMPASRDELSDHDLIATNRRGRLFPWRFDTDGVTETWPPPARLSLDGSALTLAAIRAGRGIGVVPHWLAAEDLASGRLKAVLPGHIAGHLPIHVLWPSAPVILPRLRVTIDAVTEAITGSPAFRN